MTTTSNDETTATDERFEAASRELKRAELELMLQRERVAELRRALPTGPVVENYTFDSSDGPVELQDLFTGPDRTLILYHFMFGKAQSQACPMCSMWADGWNAVADHLGERVDLAMVSAAPVAETTSLAERRGWTNLRWLSGADNSFKVDIGGEDAEGNQWPFISIYRLEDGQARLVTSGGAHIDGDHWRGLDLLSPVWHLLDLTPEGRGDWMPSS